MQHRRWLSSLAIVLGLLLLVSSVLWLTWRIGEVNGTVTANGKPLADAIVRVKVTQFETRTDRNGRYVLKNFPPRFNVHVTAWVDGYYVGGGIAFPWQRTVDISLQPYRTGDNPAYRWLPPKVDDRPLGEEILVRAGLPIAARFSFNHLFLPLAAKLKLGCSDCHDATIFKEYASGAHAQGTNNILFRTTYNGTDTRGHQSPPTSYGVSRDYGRFPLRPDLAKPWYGPGFKLDFSRPGGQLC